MFTGLVETVGQVVQTTGTSPRRLTIACSIPASEVALGDSIAIDGCCLTVVEKSASGYSFEAATETLERTTIGTLKPGMRVNLERALRVGDRLGGHMVSGHVEGVGKIAVREQRGSALYIGVQAPAEVVRLTSERGSITLAGVSLTVTSVQDDLIFVGLIPHTLAVTTLGDLKINDEVNLEADLIARYVERLLSGYRPSTAAAEPKHASRLTEAFLKEQGFV